MPVSSNYDSSNFPDIPSGIAHAASNPLVDGNTRLKVSYKGRLLDDYRLIKRYSQYVFDNLADVTVNPSAARYRPQAVAADQYGTADLWWLVLWSGGWASKVDFVPPESGVIRIFDPSFLGSFLKLLRSTEAAIAQSKKSPYEAVDMTLVKIVV